MKIASKTTMLLQFSVENFRSIKERQTLVLEASADDTLERSNVHIEDGTRILRSAAIYGPNASGKSSLVEAMAGMRHFVLSSAREGQLTDEIPVDPFLLNEVTEKAPTVVEWQFLLKGVRYRYGFSANEKVVRGEWLFRRLGTAKESRLFVREGQIINVNPSLFREGQVLKKLEKDLGNTPVRENALVVSVCANLNGTISTDVLSWFERLRFVSGLSDRGHFLFTVKQLKDPVKRQQLLEFAQRADFHLCGLGSNESVVDVLPKGIPEHVRKQLPPTLAQRVEIKTQHQRLDKNGKQSGTVEFDLETDESQGTQKFVALSAPLHDTVEKGAVLVVDEFEARLHPLLTRAIFEWFHERSQGGTAQLVVATHDAGLMDPELLRRDQIWFCEKNPSGETSVYCLAEFDSNIVRPTTKFNRQYMLGLLGGVPKLALTNEVAHGA